MRIVLVVVFLLMSQIGFSAPKGRSVVYGSNGMVATAHPVATQIAVEQLKSGANEAMYYLSFYFTNNRNSIISKIR